MRKLTVIMLALLMVLSSATMAMAAPFDLIKADGSETHSFIDFIDSPSIFDEVANNMTEYLIEDSNGQLFRVSEVQDRLDAGAETLADAVVDLTPVEINEELTVESVSAIDKTIELNVAVFEAEEDATAKVAIFALDDEGEKTGTAIVTANAAEIEENIVTFDVSTGTFGDDEYVIEVTIGEETLAVNVELEFEAVEELVESINDATAAQLATLLADETYFTGFDVAKVDDYYTEKEAAKPLSTIAEVQELVIDAVEANSEFDAFVDELEDEDKGTYAKYLVLKGQFSNVLDANMDDYMNIAGPIFSGDLNTLDAAMTDFDAISDAIDVINLDAVVAGDDGIAFGDIDDDAVPSDLNAYKAALEALVLVNDEVTDANGNTKAEIIEAIDAQLEAITDARETADEEIAKAEEAMSAYEVAIERDVDEDNPDDDEYFAVVAAIDALDDEDLSVNELDTTTLEAAVGALEDVTEEITIVDEALEKLAAFVKAFGEDAELETVYIDIETELGGDLDNPSIQTDVPTLRGLITALEAETGKWETYNAVVAAKTATEMRGLLFEFGNSDYVDLTSAQKLEFAEMFIAAVAEDEPADFDAVDVLLGTEVTVNYIDLIDAVNAATTISGMTTALEAISEDYDALGAQAKADIAEAVLAGAPDYETLAEIEAAMGL